MAASGRCSVECDAGIRGRTLLEEVKGKPLIAQLIKLYPHSVALVLNDEEMTLERCGDQDSCEWINASNRPRIIA